jgi:hypothetical protein
MGVEKKSGVLPTGNTTFYPMIGTIYHTAKQAG